MLPNLLQGYRYPLQIQLFEREPRQLIQIPSYEVQTAIRPHVHPDVYGTVILFPEVPRRGFGMYRIFVGPGRDWKAALKHLVTAESVPELEGACRYLCTEEVMIMAVPTIAVQEGIRRVVFDVLRY